MGLNCPAKTQGIIVGCRFCIYIPGGVSDLCLTFIEQRKRMIKITKQGKIPDEPEYQLKCEYANK